MIGGWAVIAHGLPRATLDVDLFIRPTQENAKRLIDALSEVGFGIARELDPQDLLSRHVLQFADQIRVDIFTKPWGLDDFQTCWDRRWEAEFESTRIPFLALEDLVRSKKTDREQDRADLAALERIARERKPR